MPFWIKVDLFDPAQGSVPPELNNFACCDGTLVDCDERRDIGLVRIRPGRRLPASKIVPPRWQPRAGMTMLTMGCSEGNDPTAWTTQITNPRVRGLADNDDYEGIECEFAPRQGRTGGGLFAVDHHLAGVCDFAEPQNNHGLYASPDSIYRLLDRNNLSFLYDEPAVTAAQLDDLLRAAERQLDKDDRAGADLTIERLNSLIEERRQELQAALRRWTRTTPQRRDELLRRATQKPPADPTGQATKRPGDRNP